MKIMKVLIFIRVYYTKQIDRKITNINFMLHNCSIVCMYANTLVANKNSIVK